MANPVVRNLKALWEAWKRVAHRIGNFQARVILTALYSVLLLPFGLAARLFSDPLRIKSRPSHWTERAPETHDMNWAQKQ